MQLRFEVVKHPTEQDYYILTIYKLSGDFSTGQIKNSATLFKDISELSEILNATVNQLIKE